MCDKVIRLWKQLLDLYTIEGGRLTHMVIVYGRGYDINRGYPTIVSADGKYSFDIWDSKIYVKKQGSYRYKLKMKHPVYSPEITPLMQGILQDFVDAANTQIFVI